MASSTMDETTLYRLDKDALGEISVPTNALWGAQTERSKSNFPFGSDELMPREIVRALAEVKKAAAQTNLSKGKLQQDKAEAIIAATDEVLAGKHWEHFPLVIWQTGSGTQSNMNMNEVVGNLASVRLGGKVGQKAPVHPNDDVNMGQSSNDVFPTAMNVAVVIATETKLLPALKAITKSFRKKEEEFKSIVKIGRTHLMDAVPMTLGQEFSAFAAVLEQSENNLQFHLEEMRELAQGGTAVGTGLNSYSGFGEKFAEVLSDNVGQRLISAPNKFKALSSLSGSAALAGSLSTLASSYMKIANDLRLLASGPRAGLGELVLPANEPGSSIMPGKVNPTQCESATMACVQVIGNCSAVNIANSHGHLQLNVFLPLAGSNLIRSINLLSNSFDAFRSFCLDGIVANSKQISLHVKNSLMLVTALNPYIGYDNAAKIALNAHHKNLSLKESAVELGILSADDVDRYIVPENMVSLDTINGVQ